MIRLSYDTNLNNSEEQFKHAFAPLPRQQRQEGFSVQRQMAYEITSFIYIINLQFDPYAY